jgi:hypothetical protein
MSIRITVNNAFNKEIKNVFTVSSSTEFDVKIYTLG